MSFENFEVKMRETMKFENYQDQSQPPVGQRNGKPLQLTFFAFKRQIHHWDKISEAQQLV